VGLGELQAFQAASSSPTYNDPTLDERHEIVDFVKRGYGTRHKLPSVIALGQAFDILMTLRLLGTNDKELGRIVGESRYDQRSKSYPRLEEELKARRKALGLMNNGDFEIILGALQARFDVDKFLERRAARRVACEALNEGDISPV
jgi:hypothetical protein